MIYKNTIYNKVNENFDFSKIKSHRIENDYQLTPELVRSSINKNINPYLLLNIQYNIKYPLRLAKSKRFNEETGYFYFSDNINNLTYYSSYHIQHMSINKRPCLSAVEENRITNANFKWHVYSDIIWLSDGSINEKEIPEWFKSLVIGIYKEFDIEIDFNKPKRYTYGLSPDDGIVIIKELVFNIDKNDPTIKSGDLILYPIVAYTGLVVYEYNKFKSDRKEYNKVENLNLNINRFTTALLKKYASIFKYEKYRTFFTPILKNDHIILYNNERLITYLAYDVKCGNITCVKDIFFNSRGCINPFIMEVNDAGYLQEFKNILYKSNDDYTNTTAGYISDDGLMCLYFVNDYDTLVKLIGQENADNAELVSYELGKNLYEDGSDFYTYMFWYVTDKGMELFKKYQNGEISLKNI